MMKDFSGGHFAPLLRYPGEGQLCLLIFFGDVQAGVDLPDMALEIFYQGRRPLDAEYIDLFVFRLPFDIAGFLKDQSQAAAIALPLGAWAPQ